MSDRNEKSSQIRDRASSRRERMGKRFEDDKQQDEPRTQQRQTPATCQAETRDGSQCSNDATDGEYCGKHAPNEAGERPSKFQRVQMHMKKKDKRKLFRLKNDFENTAWDELDTALEESQIPEEEQEQYEFKLSKKEFERTVIQLVTKDDEFQEKLFDKLSEKYLEGLIAEIETSRR